MLKKMREWLEKNYHGENKNYLEDIKKAEPMFERREYEQRDFTYATSQIRQMQSKRTGDLYINRVQRELRHTYQNNYIQSQKNNENNENKNNDLDNIDEIEDDNKENNKDIYKTDIQVNKSNTNNKNNKKCCIV